MADYEPQGEAGDAFEFTGTWREYLPIALSNLALTIVTLGIYRFWAKARERRYLWSRTRFVDDRLEWTGTGKEMFIGFLMVALLLFLPLFLLNLWFQSLLLKGQQTMAGAAFLGIYLILTYIGGFAQFRALRYRLSRTYWHGIRGGAEDKGFRYAVSALWKPIAGAAAIGVLIPWSMTSLWNERWNAMSFGPDRFEAGAQWESLIKRWIFFLLSPPLVLLLAVVVGGGLAATGAFQSLPTNGASTAALVVIGLAFIFGLYALIAAIGLGYYAAYFRECVNTLSLGGLEFQFHARSKDWLLLFLGDIALVVLTLGVGIAFIGYRHWSFFIRHMGATGEVRLDQLTQSQASGTREAEGFADAFDIGAI